MARALIIINSLQFLFLRQFLQGIMIKIPLRRMCYGFVSRLVWTRFIEWFGAAELLRNNAKLESILLGKINPCISKCPKTLKIWVCIQTILFEKEFARLFVIFVMFDSLPQLVQRFVWLPLDTRVYSCLIWHFCAHLAIFIRFTPHGFEEN